MRLWSRKRLQPNRRSVEEEEELWILKVTKIILIFLEPPEHETGVVTTIREGSNLDPETGYPDQGISWFSSVPPDNAGFYNTFGHDRFLPYSSQLIH
jgi:hypothetical protein